MFRLELFRLQRGCLGALAKVGQAFLQPDGGAFGGIEVGVQLIGQIGIRIGPGDAGCELRVGGFEGDGDDRASRYPLHRQGLLDIGGRHLPLALAGRGLGNFRLAVRKCR